MRTLREIVTEKAEQKPAIALPPFEKSIKLEFSLDLMFHMLLSIFPETYKHRELLAHAIVGSGNEHSLAYILGAMVGTNPMINYQVGDIVICTDEKRKELLHAYDEESKPVMAPIGECKVVEINLYSTKQLRVEFEQAKHYDAALQEVVRETTSEWVSAKDCMFVPDTKPAVVAVP